MLNHMSCLRQIRLSEKSLPVRQAGASGGKHLINLILVILLIVLITSISSAQIPRVLSYQGILTDSTGNPKPDGSYMITFRLYELNEGGSEIWSEQKTLQVKRGLFSTTLGDQDPFGDDVKFDRAYWLGLQVESEPELSPRIPLTSVGYSLNSTKSDTAKFAHSTPQQNLVDSARIAGTIPDNTITSDKILDGTIQRVDVAQDFTAPKADTATVALTALSSAPTGAAGGDLTGTYPNPSIADNVVTSVKILDGTIQRVDVTPDFTAPYSDTATYARVAPQSGFVDSARIAGMVPDNSITNSKLTEGSVTSAKILDGTIASADVADNAITATKIASNAVTTAKILDGTILRADVISTFKAPYADTSDFARALAVGSGWNLTGNAGTTAGTNFVGTTDAQAFDIRTNNLLRTRITTKGQIETYNTGQSVFVGEGAGANDDLSDNQNVFVGYRAGFSNTTGYWNTANGVSALNSNTTGSYNTANGVGALFSNVAGSNATAIGTYAMLYANNTSTPFTNYNVAVGYEALRGSTTASANTGNGNTALGYQTLFSNTTGGGNTANGSKALYSNFTGNNNTALGYYAFSSGTAYSNSTALGFNAVITASGQVRVGNSAVTSIGGQVGWTALSDGRFKKYVTESVKGLDFIMKLRPVTYTLDMDRIASFLKTPDSLRLKESEAVRGKILQTGFIAQEVEKSAKDLGYDFSGVDAPKNENDFYGLRYAEFVVPLVKAVQEQQKLIEELTRRIEELEKK